MSREVATKESVSAARQHLLSRGITPTQRNVLEITGGSISTVNRFMKELDEEGRDMLGPGDRTQERLGALVKALHAELQLQAKETITRAAAENEKLLDKANGDLEAVQQDYDALKAQLTEVDQKCEYQADECAKVIGENNRANTEITAQARSLAHTEQARVLLETRASKLERDLTRSQDAFIAYQDLMGENRRRDQDTFNSALEGIRLELRESGNQLSSANLAHQDTTARNLVLNRDAERLSSEVGNLTENLGQMCTQGSEVIRRSRVKRVSSHDYFRFRTKNYFRGLHACDLKDTYIRQRSFKLGAATLSGVSSAERNGQGNVQNQSLELHICTNFYHTVSNLRTQGKQ